LIAFHAIATTFTLWLAALVVLGFTKLDVLTAIGLGLILSSRQTASFYLLSSCFTGSAGGAAAA